MTITKHGLKVPHDSLHGIRSVYNEDTEMSGTLFTTEWPVKSYTRFFLMTVHDAVGLETWYEAPSYDEADQFLDQIKVAWHDEEDFEIAVAVFEDSQRCSAPGDNHSEDLIEVSRGSGTIVLCGFHAEQKVYPSSSQAGLASFQVYPYQFQAPIVPTTPI